MNIITGIKDGIVRFASTLWDAAKDAAKGALDHVKGFLGIHSPSRVFRDQVGVMIGRGMAEGIDGSQRYVSRSMDRLLSVGQPDIGSLSRAARASIPTSDIVPAMAGSGRRTDVKVDIDARGTDPEVLMAMFGTRTEAAVNRWG